MPRLSIKELIDLVASGVASPEQRLDAVFEWAHARNLELAKWLLAVAGALFVPVLISYFKGELSQPGASWFVLSAIFGSVLLSVLGLLALIRSHRSYQTYVATQSLLGQLQRIAPFLQRYREEE
jgi:hypothetical protein